jgi:hypothetical protein
VSRVRLRLSSPIALVVGAGILLAMLLVWLAERRPARARFIYGVALVVAALIYVGFAVLGGADARWLGIEAFGVALFGAAAYVGVTAAPLVLALAWIAHISWDFFHSGSAYTPGWYIFLCAGFDAVIAIAVFKTIFRP